MLICRVVLECVLIGWALSLAIDDMNPNTSAVRSLLSVLSLWQHKLDIWSVFLAMGTIVLCLMRVSRALFMLTSLSFVCAMPSYASFSLWNTCPIDILCSASTVIVFTVAVVCNNELLIVCTFERYISISLNPRQVFMSDSDNSSVSVCIQILGLVPLLNCIWCQWIVTIFRVIIKQILRARMTKLMNFMLYIICSIGNTQIFLR